MKLKIEYINEETNQKIIVKNKGSKVVYHNSETHNSNEYEELTDRIVKLEKDEREVVNAFYQLCGNL